MAIATYEEALSFWFSRVNYEQRGMPTDPAALKLDRMHALLRMLGQPDDGLAVVHVTGTKGKGSVAAFLDGALRRAGHRTGLFTSPHLVRVEERIQIDGRPIAPAELTALMAALEPAVLTLEARGQGPTFFEIVTALAFLAFAGGRVDWAVLEVGLGGRLDATNVCRPRLTVITSVSFDHVQQLGPTLAAIAGEKAGILKPGVPAVSGVTAPEARDVVRAVAARLAAPLTELGREFTYRHVPGRVTAEATRWPTADVVTPHGTWTNLELGLLGEHQAANAAVAVACVEELRRQGVTLPEAAVREALRAVDWPARMEVVGRRPLVVLDCAHNGASIQAVVDTLGASFPPARRGLVFASARDKDLDDMLPRLVPHFARAFFTRFASTRAVPPEELTERWARAGGGPAEVWPAPAAAWEAARAWARPEDLVLITGSVFLAGELRPVVLPG